MKNILPALLLVSFSLAHADTDCQSLYEAHLESDMTLTYEKFDQTMDSGFRVLAGKGCAKEAADLIEQYIGHNSAEQSSLRWHVAQLRASHGNNEEAIRFAKTTLIENEDFSVRPLRWNDYVLATIAFLEQNEENLAFHRERVADGVDEHQGNAMNLRILDAFVQNFGADYATALRTLH